MSQILLHDQDLLYKNATELITRFESQDQHSDFELIEISGKPKSAEKIRESYHRMNLDPLDKAMEKGSDYVREYFNGSALRKRKLLEGSKI